MFDKNRKNVSFFGIGIVLILSGAIILSTGTVMWLFNVCSNSTFAMPSAKIIGGLIVLALGYIQLELEWIRTK
jgi:hypothetical protein